MGQICLKTALPGPKSQALLQRRQAAISAGVSLPKLPIFAAQAKGALVTDVDGNVFIDFAGGIGCLNAGHGAPQVLENVHAQVENLQHGCFQALMYEPYVALAEKLISLSPGTHAKKVALFNSGAEAVENAVKIARRATGRQGIVCFGNAFHGRTLLALSLTSKVKPYKDGFGPFAPEIYQADFPYLYKRPEGLSEEAFEDYSIAEFHRFLKRTVAPDRIAAIMIETVLGEGGFLTPPTRFLHDLQKTCQDNGIVFILDEVQAGFGRTGKMFAYEHFGLEPDLVTCAKSMSNGFPVSAVIGKAAIMDAVQPGGLGSTFGGNPVACVAALGAIATIEKENLCERATHIGQMFHERMQALQAKVNFIGEVRGLGAMKGLEIVGDNREPAKEIAEEIVARCAHQGLLMLTAGVEGNIIRTLMPLVMTDEQMNEALDILEKVMLSV